MAINSNKRKTSGYGYSSSSLQVDDDFERLIAEANSTRSTSPQSSGAKSQTTAHGYGSTSIAADDDIDRLVAEVNYGSYDGFKKAEEQYNGFVSRLESYLNDYGKDYGKNKSNRGMFVRSLQDINGISADIRKMLDELDDYDLYDETKSSFKDALNELLKAADSASLDARSVMAAYNNPATQRIMQQTDQNLFNQFQYQNYERALQSIPNRLTTQALTNAPYEYSGLGSSAAQAKLAEMPEGNAKNAVGAWLEGPTGQAISDEAISKEIERLKGISVDTAINSVQQTISDLDEKANEMKRYWDEQAYLNDNSGSAPDYAEYEKLLEEQKQYEEILRELYNAKDAEKMSGYTWGDDSIVRSHLSENYNAANLYDRVNKAYFDTTMDFGVEYTPNRGVKTSSYPIAQRPENYMTQEERDTFNKLWHYESEEAATAYFERLTPTLEARGAQQVMAEAKQFTEDYPNWAWVQARGANAMKPISSAFMVGDILNGEGVRENSAANMNTRAANFVDSYVPEVTNYTGNTKFLGRDLDQFLYGTVGSTVDSAVRMMTASFIGGPGAGASLKENAQGIARATGALMSLEVFPSVVLEEKEKGRSDTQAVLLGAVRAAIEGFTEKYSVELLFSPSKTIGGFLLKGAAAEGSEEIAATVLNGVVDIIAADRDNILQEWDRRTALGIDPIEALADILVERGESTLADGMSGALSGLLFSAGGAASGAMTPTTQSAERMAQSVEVTEGLVKQALAENPNNRIALQAQKDLAAGKTISAKTVQKLIESNESVYRKDDQQTIASFVASELTNRGEVTAVNETANAIAKAVVGENLSDGDLRAIENSVFGKQLYNEVTGQTKGGEWLNQLRDNLDVVEIARPQIQRETKPTAAKRVTVKNADAATKDGTAVQIVGLEAQTDGNTKVKVKGSDGAVKVMAASELELNEISKDLIEGVAKFKGAAPAIYAAYMPTNDVGTYLNDVEYIVTAANGVAADNNGATILDYLKNSKHISDLADVQIETIFNAALAEGRKALAEAQPLSTSGSGQFTYTAKRAESSLKGREAAATVFMQNLAKAFPNIDIEVFESTARMGKYIGEQGSYSNGKIRIDLNAGKNFTYDAAESAMLRTLSHELTHHLQRTAPKQYAALKAFVTKHLAEWNGGTELDDLISAKQRRSGGKLSYAAALDEVVADSCEMMLKNSAAVKQLAVENKGLFSKIRDFVKKFLSDLRRAFAGVEANDAAARYLKKFETEMQKLWDEAFTASVQNAKTTAAENAQKNTAPKDDVQYADRQKNNPLRDIYAKRVLDSLSDRLGSLFPLSAEFKSAISADMTPVSNPTVASNSVTRNQGETFYHAAKDAFAREYGAKTVFSNTQLRIDATATKDFSKESLSKAANQAERQVLLDLTPYYRDLFESGRILSIERILHDDNKNALLCYRIYNAYLREAETVDNLGNQTRTLTPHIVVFSVNQSLVGAKAHMVTDINDVAIHNGRSSQQLQNAAHANGNIAISTIADVYNIVKRIDRKKGGLKYTDSQKLEYLFDYTQKDDGTQYSERDHIATRDSLGNELSEQQQKFFAKSKAVDRNGKLVLLYHGTTNGGFTVFDSRFSDDKLSLFAADNLNMAFTYSGSKDVLNLPKGKPAALRWTEGSGTKGKGQVGVYQVYYNLTNPLIIDGHGENWDNLSVGEHDVVSFRVSQASGGSMYGDVPVVVEITTNGRTRTTSFSSVSEMRSELTSKYNSSVASAVASKTMRSVQSGNEVTHKIHWSNETHKEVPAMTTRDLAKKAKAEGYDGLIVRNIIDSGKYGKRTDSERGTIYVAFDSNQIKSVDNKNPTSHKDIRYSDRDSDNRKLTEAQREYFRDSKSRDADGNLMVMYRGDANEVTVFDRKKSKPSNLYGRGFYFTNSKSHASQYGNAQSYYLNITNPLSTEERTITREQMRNFLEAVAENEDYGLENYGYGSTVDSVLRQVMKADSDFSMLQDVSATAIGDLVAAAELFNEVNGTTFDGFILPTETVIFNSNQAKLTSNTNPTTDPDTRRSERDYEAAEISKLEQRIAALEQGKTDAFLAGQMRTARQAGKETRRLTEKIDTLKGKLEEAKQTAKDTKKASAEERNAANLRAKNLEAQIKKLTNEAEASGFLAGEMSVARQAGAEIRNREEQIRKLKAELADRKAAYRENISTYRVGRKKAAVIESIKRLETNLQNQLLGKSGKGAYVPVNLVNSAIGVARLLDTSGSPTYTRNGEVRESQTYKKYVSVKEALLDLQDQYNQLPQNPDPEYAQEYTSEFASMLTELRNAIGDKNVHEMTLAQLQDVYSILRQLTYTLIDAKKQIGKMDARTNYEIGTEIMDEMKAVQGKDGSVFRQMGHTMNLNVTSPLRNINRMTGYIENSALVELFSDINDGIKRQNAFRMDANKMFDELRAGDLADVYATACNKLVEFDILDEDGNKVQMTMMQAMQLLLSYEREASNEKLHHLERGGAIIPDHKLLQKGKLSDATLKGTVIPTFTPEDAQKIRDAVKAYHDAYGTKFVEVSRQFFNSLAKDAINDTTMITHHRPVATDKNYIPFSVDQGTVSKELEGLKYDSTIEGSGILKSVKPQASNPLVIVGLNHVIDRHIEDVARIYGLSIPIRNFNKVWNVKTIGSNMTTKKAVGYAWGAEGQKMIEQAITDLQTSREKPSDIVSKALNAMQSNFVKATLLSNISVTIKQAASYSVAGLHLSQRALAPYQTTVVRLFANPEGNFAQNLFDEIDTYTPEHWIRRQGMSTQELGDLAQRQGKLVELERQIPTALNPVKWIQNMDVATTAALWLACKKQVQLDGNTKVGTDAYWTAVTELYERVIEETQPMYDVLHRPEVQKTTNALVRNVVMFKTQPLQNSGVLFDTYGEMVAARKGNDKGRAKAATQKFGRAVFSQVASLAVFSTMSLLAYAVKHKIGRYRDDDDELTAGSVLWRMVQDMMSSAAGLLLPVGGTELYDFIDRRIGGSSFGDSISVPTVQILNEFLDASGKMIDVFTKEDAEGWENALWEFAERTAAITAGLPIQNVANIIDGIRLSIKDIQNGVFPVFNNTNVDRENSTNYDRLWNAIMDGDAAKYGEVYDEVYANLTTKDEKTARDARADIASGITERVKEAFYAGEIDEAAASKYLSEYGGKNSDEISSMILKWKLKVETGMDYDDLSDEFVKGEISADEFKNFLMNYGGAKEEDAEATVQRALMEKEVGIAYDDMKGEYLDGKLSDADVRNYLAKYGGKSETAIDKTLSEWSFEKTHDIAYGDMKQAFLDGEISRSEAVVYRMEYGGAKESDAEATVTEWEFEKKYGYAYDDMRSEFVAGRLSEENAIAYRMEYGGQSEKEASKTVAEWKLEKDAGVEYDDLKQAFLDGDVTDEDVITYRTTYGGQTTKEAEATLAEWKFEQATGLPQSELKGAFVDGEFTADEAEDMLVDYAGKSRKDAEADVAKWQMEVDTGYSYDDMRSLYLDGDITKNDVISYQQKYGGKTSEAAQETANEYEFEKTYGWAYGDKATLYKGGDITSSELRSALINYGGMTSEEADLQIKVYDLEEQGYTNVTAARIKDYDEFCASSGVPYQTYFDLCKTQSNTENDKDENGDTINYSAVQKVMAAINATTLTPEQKTAVALSFWKSSTVNKYKVW